MNIGSRSVEKRELVIIDAGPAGMVAAVYGRRAGLDVIVLEKGQAGGQILITSEIENWPGTLHTDGVKLADTFREHALHLKAEFRTSLVQSISVEHDRKVVHTDTGDIEAGAIIIATGASFRRLGCRGESRLIGKGVSFCAVCDGAFFEGLDIAVIGGGNTAVEEATYLTRFASKVFLIHRRNEFRADRIVVERALANPKIVPIYDSIVEEIRGEDMVEGLVLKNVRTENLQMLDVSGVFIFVGTVPNTTFLRDLLTVKTGGWIDTDEQMQTSVPGIFAAGDVRNTSLRQVITAAADGARAAMSAYTYLAH